MITDDTEHKMDMFLYIRHPVCPLQNRHLIDSSRIHVREKVTFRAQACFIWDLST